MPFSDYLDSKILTLIFHDQDFTPPSYYYIGLSITDPSKDGSTNTEPSASYGYARVQFPNEVSATGFKYIDGYVINSGNIIFPQTTGTTWGTINYVTLWDAQINGNFIAYGTLKTPLVSELYDIVKIKSGEMEIAMNTGV